MSFLANINKHRREIMRSLTRSIGSTYVIPAMSPGDKPVIRRILISRPNSRLGNMLLITSLIQEISCTFPDAKIDLFVRGGIAPVLFKNYSNVEQIIQLPGKPFKHLLNYAYSWLRVKKYRYDLAINVVKNSSSGRLSTKFASGKFKMYGDVDAEITSKYTDHQHVAKYPVYNFRRFMTLIGFPENEKAVPALNLKLNLPELAEGHRQLKNLVNNNKRTIGIFTYATGSKCYSPKWWGPFYQRLKQEFPNYNIVEILPKENISQIDFKAASFYSNDVREIGGFIANTDVFIGADSGIMHLASAVQTPTVGLFHVTEKETFGPYGNNSIAVDTNTTNEDELIRIIRNILITRCIKPEDIIKSRLTA